MPRHVALAEGGAADERAVATDLRGCGEIVNAGLGIELRCGQRDDRGKRDGSQR